MEPSQPLQTATVTINDVTVKIIKEKNDPLCTRISAGGTMTDGLYLVYRGELKEVRTILQYVQDATRLLDEGVPDESLLK